MSPFSSSASLKRSAQTTRRSCARLATGTTYRSGCSPKGPDTVFRFHPVDGQPSASCCLSSGLNCFLTREFTQVNPWINQVLIRRAMGLLDPQPGERIADMFCGLGNFTLPYRPPRADVVGIEGNQALVERAAQNAAANGLSERTSLGVANLFEATEESIAALGHFDKMLIDPPREGALELVKSLGEKHRAELSTFPAARRHSPAIRHSDQPAGAIVSRAPAWSTCSRTRPTSIDRAVREGLRSTCRSWSGC